MTHKTLKQLIVFTTIIASVIIFSSCTSNNWPQFRGPGSNMVVTGKNLPTEWANDKNVKWTYDFEGYSWSSPIIWGDKVFITSAIGVKAEPIGVFEPRPESRPEVPDTSGAGQERPEGQPPQGGAPGAGQERQQQPPPPRPPEIDTSYLQEIYRWEVTCLDIKTGAVVWKQVAFEGNPRGGINRGGSSYANETPATDGKRVYAYFGNLGMFCYDIEGNLLWQKDLGAYNTLMEWGTGSSPVVYQDVVYQQVDNEESSFIVALDAATGEQIWKAPRDEKTTYSTPVIWKNSVRTELVASGKTARSYDLKTGNVLWQLKMNGEMIIPSPVPDKDRLYIGNAGGMESKGSLYSVKAGAEGDITPAEGELTGTWVEWSNPEAGTGNTTPLVYKGLVYILSGRGGEVSCFDAATGKLVYKEKVEKAAGSWASPWAAGNKICFTDEKGVTTVIKAGGKLEIVTQNKLDDRFWASVGIAGNKYIFKGRERVYCVGL
jgi:outer membrane protein assembly factor BamB